MKHALLFLVLTASIFSYGYSQSKGSKEKLIKEFKNPPKEFSLIPFWFLNGDLNERELTRQMEDFVAHGVYGVVLHPRMGLSREVGYLTERWFQLIQHIAKEAQRLEMHLILYDEGMYPSGSAMGKVVGHNPQFASQGIRLEQQEPDKNGKYDFSINHNERVIGIVSAKIDSNSKIEEETLQYLGTELRGMATEGKVVYLLKQTPTRGMIRGVHFGEDTDNLPQDNPPPSADLLNPDATRKFIEFTHDKYNEAIGEYFGNVVLAMFTDEPSIMGRSGKRGLKPWTWDYEDYLKDYSEALTIENIPLLFLESNDGLHEKVRSDFKRAEARRLNESFYGLLSQWCVDHGIELTGHPHGANEITPQKYFGIPGQDVVLRWVLPDSTALESDQSMNAKSASSAARNWDRRLALNECFGAYQMQFTTDEMKWLTDWLLVRGINKLSPHAFYYSIEGERFYERPPDVGPNNLWWKHYRLFADYAARMSWLNTDNQQVCEVAVYGEHNQYGYLSAKVMFQNQIDFNYIDETIRDATKIDTPSTFKNNKIQIGKIAYSTIILDGISKISDKGLEFLKKCSENGIKIILFGEKELEGLNELVIRYIHCKSELALQQILINEVPRDVISVPAQQGLRVSHVIKGGVDFYFCVNEQEESIDCELSIPVLGKAEYWDAEEGAITPCISNISETSRMSIPLKLHPRQSVIIAVDEALSPNTICTKSGKLDEYPINGTWTLESDKLVHNLEEPKYWTDLKKYQKFSGTMTYKVVFDIEQSYLGKEVVLDLGHVKEFATVTLNGTEIGTRLWRPFHYVIPENLLLQEKNMLEIKVTNSLANEFGEEWMPSGLNEDIRLLLK